MIYIIKYIQYIYKYPNNYLPIVPSQHKDPIAA